MNRLGWLLVLVVVVVVVGWRAEGRRFVMALFQSLGIRAGEMAGIVNPRGEARRVVCVLSILIV